jgi:hypothetical protein
MISGGKRQCYRRQNCPVVFQPHYNCHREYSPNQHRELGLHMAGKEGFLAEKIKQKEKTIK